MGFFTIFLWNDKGNKIKRNVIINDYLEGGLKMIGIDSFNKSLKAIWIKNFELRKYGGIVIFTGNLNKKKDTSTIKISDPFFFSEVFFL